MFKTFVLFDVLQHPFTALIVLVSASNAKQSSVVSDNSTAEFRNVVVKVNQVLRLLMTLNIIEMDVFVPPFEVVDNPLICQFFLYNEDVLKEINNSFVDIKMVKLCNHCFLTFQIHFVLADKSISVVDHISDVVENLDVVVSVSSWVFQSL